jgi:hypothetical protein
MSLKNPITGPSSAEQSTDSILQDFAADSTLVVGRNASLTLGTDSLIVLGMPPTASLERTGLTLFRRKYRKKGRPKMLRALARS